MSESEPTNEQTFLTLPLDGGPKDFDDLEELSEWVNIQRNSFSWLQKATQNQGNIQQSWNVLNESIDRVENFCNRYAQLNEQQRRTVTQRLTKHFSNVVRKGSIRTTESVDVAFVESLRKDHSDTVAAYSYAFLTNHDFHITSSASFSGAHLAMRYRLGSTETVKAQKKSLESAKRSWSVKFGKLHKKLQMESDTVLSNLEERRESFDSLISDLDQQKKDQSASFEEICQESREELNSIAETYDRKLALQSSVSYWGKKRRSHNLVMWITGIMSIFVGAATSAGFVWVAYIFLQGNWIDIELWRFAVLVAISTFGIWLTRLFGKIFVANLHLRTDAQERETMILTYLAMLRVHIPAQSEHRFRRNVNTQSGRT